MKILVVESSSAVLSLAVFEAERLLLEMTLDYQKTHSEKLIPLIHEGLTQLKLKPAELDVFAASIGPGSFTGLRIGVTTVKAMGQALDKPVVGVSTLEALAYNLPWAAQPICPLIDAQREAVYYGQYQWQRGQLQTLAEAQVQEIGPLIEQWKAQAQEIWFLGDGTEKFRERLEKDLSGLALFPPLDLIIPRAASVGRLAYEKIRRGEAQRPEALLPIYMRKSQAENQYEARLRKEQSHE